MTRRVLLLHPLAAPRARPARLHGRGGACVPLWRGRVFGKANASEGRSIFRHHVLSASSRQLRRLRRPSPCTEPFGARSRTLGVQFRMGVKNFLPEELQADDLAPGLRTLAYLNPGGFLPAPRLALEPRRAGSGTRRLCVVRRSRCPHGTQTFLNMVRTPDSANLTLTVAHVI